MTFLFFSPIFTKSHRIIKYLSKKKKIKKKHKIRVKRRY